MKVTAITVALSMMALTLSAQISDFSPQTPLIGALLHNDAVEAARLLREGAAPNEGHFASLTPMILGS
jgi:hypothetical protein